MWTIHETLSNYSKFGKDAEKFRLRFAVQQTRLDAIQHVLFDEDKFAPDMPGQLVHHLSAALHGDLIALLQQLHSLLEEYNAMRKQYDLTTRSPANNAGIEEVAAMAPEERMQVLVSDRKSADAAKQAAFGWVRKMLWTTFDKSSTEKLVSEFEAWTERTTVFLEAAWWPTKFFDNLDRMRRLEQDGDARNAGLLRGIGVRKLLVTPPGLISATSHAAEASSAAWAVEGRFGSFELGTLQEEGQAAMKGLVEYKQYKLFKRNWQGNTGIRERVVQLAALLHEAQSSDADLGVLQCVRYFEDTPSSQFGLVYALPLSGNPVSLASLLDANQGIKPSLSARLQLAHKVALTVQRLHTYRWVHKSLRSENVLLFPLGGLPQASPPMHSSVVSLENPKLIGFEYSRKEGDFSDAFGEGEIRRNIYRHPARWGDPTERFAQSHDLYGKQVIMANISFPCLEDNV